MLPQFDDCQQCARLRFTPVPRNKKGGPKPPFDDTNNRQTAYAAAVASSVARA